MPLGEPLPGVFPFLAAERSLTPSGSTHTEEKMSPDLLSGLSPCPKLPELHRCRLPPPSRTPEESRTLFSSGIS